MFQFPPLPPILPHQRKLVFALAGVFALIELVLQASDIGLLAPDLRWRAYELFSFYDPWFDAWLAGGPAPPTTPWTLLTHAFLHGDMTHLLLNAAVFLALGHLSMRIFGAPWLFAIFVVTAIGGALFFGLVRDTELPLVGASGAVFGLIGALKYVELRVIRRYGGSMNQYWRVILALVAVNVLMAIGLGGYLAWEAHLGGFLTGWALGWAFMPRGGGARDS